MSETLITFGVATKAGPLCTVEASSESAAGVLTLLTHGPTAFVVPRDLGARLWALCLARQVAVDSLAIAADVRFRQGRAA